MVMLARPPLLKRNSCTRLSHMHPNQESENESAFDLQYEIMYNNLTIGANHDNVTRNSI